MTKQRKFETMKRLAILYAKMKDGSTSFYWVDVPEGMTDEQAAATQKWHGPFPTDAAAEKDYQIVVLGTHEVIDGGVMHPDWDSLQ